MFLFCLVFAMSLCGSVDMCFAFVVSNCECVTFPLVSCVRCTNVLQVICEVSYQYGFVTKHFCVYSLLSQLSKSLNTLQMMNGIGSAMLTKKQEKEQKNIFSLI